MDEEIKSNETMGEDTTVDVDNMFTGEEQDNAEGMEDVMATDEIGVTADAAMSEEGSGYEDGMVSSDDVMFDTAMDDGYVDDMMDIGGYVDDSYMMGGEMMGTETGAQAKDPILSSIPFVAGTIAAALIVGIVFGILLGKKRIKKGIDLYEN